MKKIDCVYMEINNSAKKHKYDISILIVRNGAPVSHLPAKLFPTFDSIMYAYIFCVGIIHTAYQNEPVYFASRDKTIFKEIMSIEEG